MYFEHGVIIYKYKEAKVGKSLLLNYYQNILYNILSHLVRYSLKKMLFLMKCQ